MRLGDGQIHDEIYRLLAREYGQASCFSFAVMGATVAGAIIGGAIASVSPGIADPGAVVVITMGASALIAYGFKLARSRPDLSAEDIRRLMPLFHFDEGETAYLEALLALAENPYLQEETAKQIIADLNRLLDTYYQLQKQREQLQEAMGTASESEMETLQQRLAEATDPQARKALQESLDLLRRRLHSRNALSSHRQRMEAHLELILQTLKSLHESLSRLKLAPQSLEEFDIEALRLRLRELQQEATAIENAAQEVLGGLVTRQGEGTM